MRLTRSKLRRIIKEELQRVLTEQEEPVNDFGTVDITLDKKTGEPVTRMGTIDIKGSPPEDDEEYLLISVLVGDPEMVGTYDGPQVDWGTSTATERNAVYDVLAQAALKHFRSLGSTRAVADSARRLVRHVGNRSSEDPDMLPYAKEMGDLVFDAARVAGSEMGRSGMASPDKDFFGIK